MDITLRQLKYFLEIADQCSISKAATKLYTSQPPLSFQLKKLESELNVRLFDRQKNGMVITKAGIKLRDRADQILSLVDDTFTAIKNMNEGYIGTIRIGAVTGVCLYLLPKKAKKYLEMYPKVDFIIHETNPQRIGELVKNGIIDMGFVREPFNTDQVSSIKITNIDSEFKDDELVAVGLPIYFKDAKSDQIEFVQLAKIPLIIFGTYTDLINDFSARTQTEFKIICRNDNPISSIGWAINGAGVAILPRSSLTFVQSLIGDLIVKTIINPHLPANIFIITNYKTTLSSIAEKFVELFI